MSFTQIHPEEEKQLIEHKFTSEEDAFLAITLHIFLSDGKKIKVEIYLRRLKVIRTVD
jgi:hypothetical protein